MSKFTLVLITIWRHTTVTFFMPIFLFAMWVIKEQITSSLLQIIFHIGYFQHTVGPSWKWRILEQKARMPLCFFFTLRFKAKYQTKHLKDTKLQLDLTNLHSAFENSLLLQTQNHFPWICPLVIYYQLLIFKLPLLHLHFVKTIKSSRYHTN